MCARTCRRTSVGCQLWAVINSAVTTQITSTSYQTLALHTYGHQNGKNKTVTHTRDDYTLPHPYAHPMFRPKQKARGAGGRAPPPSTSHGPGCLLLFRTSYPSTWGKASPSGCNWAPHSPERQTTPIRPRGGVRTSRRPAPASACPGQGQTLRRADRAAGASQTSRPCPGGHRLPAPVNTGQTPCPPSWCYRHGSSPGCAQRSFYRSPEPRWDKAGHQAFTGRPHRDSTRGRGQVPGMCP